MGEMGPAIAHPLTEQPGSTVSPLLLYVGRGVVQYEATTIIHFWLIDSE